MSTERTQRSFVDPAVIAQLSALPLLARGPMLGSVSGRHTSPHRGASVEFAEYRKYVAGDDLRRLDWRAYGRSDRFYVKEFEADTNLRLVFALDTSGSMGFGSRGVRKLDYACRIVAALSYLAINQGDAVGLFCVGSGATKSIPARRHPAHLKTIYDTLESLRPRGKADVVAALHELAETIQQRALVLIVSDLFVDPEHLRGGFEHLKFRHHDVAVFHLLDPEEVAFTVQRPTRFLDLEGGPAVFADPSEIAEQYRTAVNQYLARMLQTTRETAIDYHRVLLDQPYDKILREFLIARTYRTASR